MLASYSVVLNDNKSTIFPMRLAVGETGTNLRVIFELWTYNSTVSSFTYTGLWNQIRINVTST